MYEYEMMNINTRERTFIWGYSYEDAFNRNPNMNPSEWDCIHAYYID